MKVQPPALAALLALPVACATAEPGGSPAPVAPVAAVAAPSPPPLRVMSFNIRIDCGGCDGENGWEHRRAGVLGMLPFHRIDLAGLQEVKPNQRDDLAAALGEYGWLGEGRDAGRDGEACPIFYRKARLERLDGGTFWLSPTPEIPGEKGWDAKFPRIATWAKLRDRASGVAFHAFNTHLDSVGPTAREQGAKLVVQRIAAIAGKGPVVVTGDMNTRPGSPPYLVLTGAGLRDARAASRRPPYPFPETGTSTGFASPPRARAIIDYILVGPGLDVASFGVITENWDLVFPSDHRPIVAEIALATTP